MSTFFICSIRNKLLREKGQATAAYSVDGHPGLKVIHTAQHKVNRCALLFPSIPGDKVRKSTAQTQTALYFITRT